MLAKPYQILENLSRALQFINEQFFATNRQA